jgi:DNA-binding transcriptional regulator YiaG
MIDFGAQIGGFISIKLTGLATRLAKEHYSADQWMRPSDAAAQRFNRDIVGCVDSGGFNGPGCITRSQIGKGRVNRERLRASSEREIARQIASDPDVPEMTAADMRRARRVYNPPVPNVKAIRHKLGLSQAEFAHQFGSACALFSSGNKGGQPPTVPRGYCCASSRQLRKRSSERWLPAQLIDHIP